MNHRKYIHYAKAIGICSLIAFFGVFSCFVETFAYQTVENDRSWQEKMMVKFASKQTIDTYYIPAHITFEQAKSDLIRRYGNEIEYIEENHLYQATFIPNDEGFHKQWYLMQINMPDVWARVQEKEEVIVAVLDTGVDIAHPDLQGRIWVNEREIAGDGIDNDNNGYVDDVHGWDFVNHTNYPFPRVDEAYFKEGVMHGTLISGVIAANRNNQIGGAGITTKTKIMPLRVLNSMGQGEAAHVINAILYAKRQGAHIINLSFVGKHVSPLLQQVIKEAYDEGILIIAAAGNDKLRGGVDLDKEPMYPICFDRGASENYVIGVAATNILDEKADFSNYGDCIDISAPGEGFFGTQYMNASFTDFQEPFGGPWAGTSLSAPLITATAALLKSAYPNLSPKQITEIIIQNADDIYRHNKNEAFQQKLGSGRLNAFRSVLDAQEMSKNLPDKHMSRLNEAHLITAPASGMSSQVQMHNMIGERKNTMLVYESVYQNGVRIATGDVNGDGKKDLITAPNAGGGPHIRIFSQEGVLMTHFMAFDPQTRSGARVATCDIDQDGKDEIIVGAGKGMSPIVRIFKQNSSSEFRYTEFLAYDASYMEGIEVACGDITGDAMMNIVVGINGSVTPHVRVFNHLGELQSQFIAFSEESKGLNITVCDTNNDQIEEIIVSHQYGGSPTVRIFHRQHDNLYQFMEFLAYHPDFRGGVNIACADINNDGFREIVTGAGAGGGPHVRWFTPQGVLKGQFFAFKQEFTGGVSVGAF